MPSLTTLVDGTIPVAADFNGNFQALNNAIGSNTSISAWAVGELPYASATNTLSRLSPGTRGQSLIMGGSAIPAWGQVASVGGCFLANNGSDATNDIDISVGARMSDDSVFGNRVYMSLTTALTKQLDATWAVGTNAGMRASGAAIANGTYHIFLIMRPDTGVVDVAADTSATGANISANTDAAYTKKWRIGSIVRSGGAIRTFIQSFDRFTWMVPITDVNVTNPGTSAVTRTLSVPTGVMYTWVGSVSVGNTAANESVLLTDLATTDTAATDTLFTAHIGGVVFPGSAVSHVVTNTSAQIRSRCQTGNANTTLVLVTHGWVDDTAMGSG